MTEQTHISAFAVEDTLAHFASAAAAIYRASDPLTEAMAELNRTPGTETDAGMARAFKQILARKGFHLVRMNEGGL